MYVVRMNGQKVRMFSNPVIASAWANKHCHGRIEITELTECKELPRACGRMYPNEDLGKLVYRPFAQVM